MVEVVAGTNEVNLLAESARGLRGTLDPKDETRAEVVEGLLAARGKDLVLVVGGAAYSTSPERTLLLASANLRANPFNPEAVWGYYNAYWTLHNVTMNLRSEDVEVSTDIPYKTEQELIGLRNFTDLNDNPVPRIPFYLPRILSTVPEGLVILGKEFPFMFLPSEGIENKVELYDWMSVELQEDAPYRMNQKGELTGLNENEVRQAFEKLGSKLGEGFELVGETVNVYAGSGPVIKDLSKSFRDPEGYFPDQTKTAVRLLGSVCDGGVLGVSFRGSGDCNVYWSLVREGRDPRWGARAVGVKSSKL